MSVSRIERTTQNLKYAIITYIFKIFLSFATIVSKTQNLYNQILFVFFTKCCTVFFSPVFFKNFTFFENKKRCSFEQRF